MKNFIIIILLTLIGLTTLKTSKKNEKQNYEPKTIYKNVSYSGNIDFRHAAKIGTKAVVHVTAEREEVREYIYFDQFYGLYDNYVIPDQKSTSGSGVIVSSEGHIITNNHVIQGFEEVNISMHDGQRYKAKVIATDPSTDLALLKINTSNLIGLEFADSDLVEIGQWVLAIGNPLNLNSTVTSGIVSAKARNINILRQQYSIESFIQTDAAVNPGNSGGALVDLEGKLIGINTAIASTTGAYSGYSFAIPSNIVRKVYLDLLNYGVVQRGFLGVFIQEMSPDIAKEENVVFEKGIYISGYSENSMAEKSGLSVGDIITHVDGVRVSSISELQAELLKKNPGMEVNVSIMRKNKSMKFLIQLTNIEGGTDFIKKS
tara:strand:+ start:3235 stop:4356 length:1122 start_codon:yes stop_codon:yes gene_type:complete